MAKLKANASIVGDINNELVSNALDLISANFQQHIDYVKTINTIRDLDNLSFDVTPLVGARRINSALLRQATDKVFGRMQIPSSSYHSSTATDTQTEKVRKAVEWIKKEGGFNEVMTDKPSAYRHMLMYGDGFIRIGADETDSPIPIRFDNLEPDKIYVDPNATVMRSKRGVRQVTRMAVIYSYDISQAKTMYPDHTFSGGEIPKSLQPGLKDFNKTFFQDSESLKDRVEICHYWDIGGDNPGYVMFEGSRVNIIKQGTRDVLEGKLYPFIMNGDPYIPIDSIRCFDSNEGFYNFGLGQAFYKYALQLRQLFNKITGQSINSLSDIKVIDLPGGDEDDFLSRIDAAREMQAAGDIGIVINDSQAPLRLNSVESSQLFQGVQLAMDLLEREIKRWGINLDEIGRAPNTTATQVDAEQAAQDQFIITRLDKNTGFFKWIDNACIEFIKEYISKNDKTVIPIVINEKVLQDIQVSPDGNMTDVFATDAQGRTKTREIKGVTLGEIKQIVAEHKFQVEIATKSGVIETDFSAKKKGELLLNFGALNPAIALSGAKKIAEATGIDFDEKLFLQQSQPQPGSPVPQSGIKNVANTQQPTGL